LRLYAPAAVKRGTCSARIAVEFDTEQRQAALLYVRVRAQGSAARRFEFAARRWVEDGTPITAGLLIEDSVYWIA
jgi:hypothetical protein